MGFIAGLFLTYMDEDLAFYTFYSILQNKKKPLRNLFLPKMIETQKVLFVFGLLGQYHLGILWKHLSNKGIHPTMYATEWFMTMYCRGYVISLINITYIKYLFNISI